VSAVVTCPVCGESVNAEAARCPQCGADHRLPASEARAEVEQRYARQSAAAAPPVATGSRGSPRGTMAALATGSVYAALLCYALLDPAGDGWGAKATGLFLLAPVIAVLQLVLLFSGRREGRRQLWERVAVVVSSVVAAACLAGTVFLIWFIILASGGGLD
jgi:hypothetical protein